MVLFVNLDAHNLAWFSYSQMVLFVNIDAHYLALLIFVNIDAHYLALLTRADTSIRILECLQIIPDDPSTRIRDH